MTRLEQIAWEDFQSLSLDDKGPYLSDGERPLHVRFIELMPCGLAQRIAVPGFLHADEVLSHLKQIGPLYPTEGPPGSGPATYYRYEGSAGTVGIIAAVTKPFCLRCNRLRLSSDGKLRTCLFSDDMLDIRALLRCGADDGEIAALFERAVREKPQSKRQENISRMFAIGG